MGKTQKPFIAARIPVGLEEALEKYTKTTGESKTKALINALSNYVGWSESDEKSEPSANDRLSHLEAKVAELEKLIGSQHAIDVIKRNNKSDNTQEKTNLKSVIETDNKVDNKPPEAVQLNAHIQLDTKSVIESDKKSDNTLPEKDNQEIASDEKPQRLYTNAEVSEITGVNPNTVKARPKMKRSQIVTGNGRTFNPIKQKRGWKWEEITEDNSVIN